MLTFDETRRPQAVNHVLYDPVGLGLHGLAAGRLSRAATGGEGRPSRRGSQLPCPAQPEYCRDADGLGYGRERQRFHAL